MMTFLLHKEMFTCEVSESSEYETNLFSYRTAGYVISIHFRPLTMPLDFSSEIASRYEKKIQICGAFSWQDDLTKLFLSAYIFSPMQCKGIQWAKCSHPHKILEETLKLYLESDYFLPTRLLLPKSEFPSTVVQITALAS